MGVRLAMIVAVAAAGACRFVPASGASRDAAGDVAREPDARAIDAPADATSCISIDGGTGRLVAPDVSRAIVVDGDLSDWTTCFITLDSTNAGVVFNFSGQTQFPHGRLSIAHDTGHVYIGAEIVGIPPLGAAPTANDFKNDAVELYFDGDGMIDSATPGYDADALQIVIDHLGQVAAFHAGIAAAAPGAVGAARLAADQRTYTIELAVTPQTFGAAAFGTSLGFTFGLDDGDGTTQLSELVWFQKCNGACPGTACNAPFCDARQFGTVALAP